MIFFYLEPDLDLAFGEAEGVCNLDAPPAGQVAIEVELFFQFQRLEPGVRLSAPLPFYLERISIEN